MVRCASWGMVVGRKNAAILSSNGGDRDQTYQQYWQNVGMPPFGDVPTAPEREGNASDTDADHSSPDLTKPPPKKKKETKDFPFIYLYIACIALYLLLYIISSSSKLLIFHRIWTVDRTGSDRIFRASVRSGPVQHAPMLGPVQSRSRFLSPGPVRSGPVALGNSVHGPDWTESCPIVKR